MGVGGWDGVCDSGWDLVILRFETGSLVIATGRRDHDTDVDREIAD